MSLPDTFRDEFLTAVLSHGNKKSTFDAYWPHVEDFVQFSRKSNPKANRESVDSEDVFRWRDHLASELHLSPSSCNQRTAAIKFLFTHVMGRSIKETKERPLRMREPRRRRRRMISREAILSVFDQLRGRDRLIVQMMYAGIMRLDDVLNIRIKDLDFDSGRIDICDCKADHFRSVPFPKSLHSAVRRQMSSTATLHADDQESGAFGAAIPYSYAKKNPSAPKQQKWYYLFSSGNLSRDPKRRNAPAEENPLMRYRLNTNGIAKKIRAAVRKSQSNRDIKPHDFRRSAATHFYQDTRDIVLLQEILGHYSVEITKLYIFAEEVDLSGEDSPFDRLMATKPK